MNTQNQVTRIENPFGQRNTQAIAQSSPAALITTESQRAIAEVQAALAIAKSFPRDRIAAVDRILNDCQRSGLAEVAVYQYSRGGTSINGPTIRLAESLAQNWGNIQYGVRELSQANGESTVEAFAWDVETNTRQTKIFQVPHIRHTRNGQTKLTDPRDIYELVANNGARRLRACILGVIPGDVVEAALQQCEATLNAYADTSAEGIQKILKAFEKYGVSKESIEKRIQCRIEAIKPAQIVSLTKIGTSLKEGMSVASDWFDLSLSQSISTKTEELSPFATLKRQILTTKTIAEVNACEDQVMEHADAEERKQLVQLLRAQREKFAPAQPVAEAQVVEAKKPEPQVVQQAEPAEKKPTSAELKKQFAKALNNAKDLREVAAIESQIACNEILNDKDRKYLEANVQQVEQKLTPTEEVPAVEFDETELEVSKFKEQIEAAQTPEALTKIRATFAANGNLSDEQHEQLNTALNQKMATLTKPKTVDLAKSQAVANNLSKMISDAATVEVLETTIASSINAHASQMTVEHLNQVKSAYAERKTFLENQISMFDDSYYEIAVEKIQRATTEQDVFDITMSPDFAELDKEEQRMLNSMANQKLNQIQQG